MVRVDYDLNPIVDGYVSGNVENPFSCHHSLKQNYSDLSATEKVEDGEPKNTQQKKDNNKTSAQNKNLFRFFMSSFLYC